MAYLSQIVYEFLPLKTRHHQFSFAEDFSELWYRALLGQDEHRNILIEEGNSTAKVTMTLVWTTIPGVSILATNRQIQAEAGSILLPRLEAIKMAPIKIISNTPGLFVYRLQRILTCLAFPEEDCNGSKDLRNLLPHAHIHFAQYTRNTDMTPIREVQIAVNNRFIDRDNLHKADDRARILQLAYQGLQSSQSAVFGSRKLQVQVRPALLSEIEQSALEANIALWTWTIGNGAILPAPIVQNSGVKKWIIGGGDVIRASEWEAGWAEGEYFWPEQK